MIQTSLYPKDTHRNLVEARVVGDGIRVHEVGLQILRRSVRWDVAERLEAGKLGRGELRRVVITVNVDEFRML